MPHPNPKVIAMNHHTVRRPMRGRCMSVVVAVRRVVVVAMGFFLNSAEIFELASSALSGLTVRSSQGHPYAPTNDCEGHESQASATTRAALTAWIGKNHG